MRPLPDSSVDECRGSIFKHNCAINTVYPEIGEPPAHDGLQASLDRVTAGLVSESAELPAVLQDVRHSLSVVSAPPTALVRTLRGSRPAR
ncbi:hypothetical protein T4C_84 [Trichinella pseudospiralis]|uniref:Uncharacterized protein n=1 Tax=Trichinella pseudospiralis TaxID=6337 RepID=A0A0V1GI43_TRIPS|nr:hypothetical protein T4C_84 [Trichinella pseudospiralis]